MIWKNPISVDMLNGVSEYMGTHLGIVFTRWDENSLEATMPVNVKTKQPWGILHGGASVVLAETLGSYASTFLIDNDRFTAVGLEINANHLRPVSDGKVTAHCEAFHIGKKTHVWNIRIVNDEGKLVCISRLTVAIIEKNLDLRR